MNEAYYILENGEQKGPFSFNELTAMDINLHTRVLSPLDDTWQDACDLPEFFPYFEARGVNFPTEDNLASFWWRLLAYAIDYFLLSIITGYIFSFLAMYGIKFNVQTLDQMMHLSIGEALSIELIVLVTLIVYNTICEASPMKGSLGKKLCGMVVVDADGMGLSWLNALGRSSGKALSIGLVYLGFLSIFFSEHRQAVHDLMAKTYVVKL